MKQRTFLFLIFAAALLFFLIGAGNLAVTDPVESNYALTAKEMVLSGDWISPRIYGIFWYDKPVFFYWLLCLSYTVFGFTELASRFPGALFGALSVTLAAWFMLQQTGKRSATLMLASMTATSLEVWAISHAIITDHALFFFTCATMFFTYIGLTEKQKTYMVLAYAMAGFAVLTKGPVGLVLPGLFFLLFACIQKRPDYVRQLFPVSGIILFLIIALSWYGTMYIKHGTDFVDGFFGLNNVVRATISEHPEDNVWYYYFVLIPVSLLPWSGPCLYALWQRRSRCDEYVYMCIWAIGTLLFYTLMATKYPTYSYIANMPLLYLGARTIMTWYHSESRRIWCILTIPAAGFWLLLWAAALFVKKAPFPLENVTALIILIPVSILLLALAQWQKALPAIPVIITAVMTAAYSILTYQVLTPFFAYRSAISLVPAADTLHGRLYFFRKYNTSFVYYTGIVPTWTAEPDFDEYAAENRNVIWNRKHVYPMENGSETALRLQQGEEITFIVPKNQAEAFTSSPFYHQTHAAGSCGLFYIYTNHQEN